MHEDGTGDVGLQSPGSKEMLAKQVGNLLLRAMSETQVSVRPTLKYSKFKSNFSFFNDFFKISPQVL